MPVLIINNSIILFAVMNQKFDLLISMQSGNVSFHVVFSFTSVVAIVTHETRRTISVLAFVYDVPSKSSFVVVTPEAGFTIIILITLSRTTDVERIDSQIFSGMIVVNVLISDF